VTSERDRRWRLILGSTDPDRPDRAELTPRDRDLDAALSALYGEEGGSGSSFPNVARWLGDIRRYFPTSVVRVLQRDAIACLNLRQLLLQPEILDAVEPDVHLAAALISLGPVLPAETRDTARQVVRRVVEELWRQLDTPTRQAIAGSLARERNRRPRYAEIDWRRTIRANLQHYQPDYRTIVPAIRHGRGRKRSALREVILCVDRSGSMASSVVYASIFAAVLASLPALETHLVTFDTAVVDLSDRLSDPVELLFGIQLGGGTDIARAIGYCHSLARSPRDTILVAISDLYEGGDPRLLLRRLATLTDSGVQIVFLLALSDSGAPAYNRDLAARVADLGIPVFACTPDAFPELMAAAIRRDLDPHHLPEVLRDRRTPH